MSEENKAESMLKEMERIAKAFQAPDQGLEYEIQRVLNNIRPVLDASEWKALDKFLHQPELLKWALVEGPTRADFFLREPFEPNEEQLEYFRNLVRIMSQEGEFEMKRTGHRYKFDKKAKTVTLIRLPKEDPDDWHNKNRVCLERIGYRLIDGPATARSFQGKADGWNFTLADFSISDQINSATGELFPPGSRGQELMAGSPTGKFMRLGHILGRHMLKAASPAFGSGKSTAAAEQLKKNQ